MEFLKGRLPIILFHLGNPTYLSETIERNRRVHTRIVLIGDSTNSHLRGVTHVHYETLRTPELTEFESKFVNYSTNSAAIEKLCFSRMFYIRKWLQLNGLTSCVHLDSDCVLLRPVNEIFNGTTAYSYVSTSDHFAASVHVSYLTMDFLLRFEQLCRNIYVTGSLFHLIEPKIRHHKENSIPGGICDMTLYYLLTKEMPVRALLDIQPDGSVFDDNINDSFGFLGKDTFVLTEGKKTIRKVGDRFEARCTTGQWIRINNLHFQGNAKQYIKMI